MGETDKNLEEATALALKYCNPDDSEIISDLDRHLREAAWILLERISNLESQECVCEGCASKVAEEVEEVEEVESTPEEQQENPEVEGESSDDSNLQKLIETDKNNKRLTKKSKNVTVGVGVIAATTQKMAAMGTAGVMTIASGTYFQAKAAKTEGIEIAVVTEQEYGAFSKFNRFTESVLGVSTFEGIREYAEKGYGDIKGSNPSSEENEEKEELSEEERIKRDKELLQAREDLKINSDEPPTNPPKLSDY
jgi:predicted DNA binding protein